MLINSFGVYICEEADSAGSGIAKRSRGGFSLIELLIGVTLFIALSAVVVPAVVTQVRKGDVSAVSAELDALAASISSFYVDVARYPSEINQLVYDPDGAVSTDDNLTTVDELGFWADNSGIKNGFPDGRIKRWDGPYLDRGHVPVSGGVSLPLNGKVQRDFVQVCSGGKRYLAIEVADIELTDARELSTFTEGTSNVGPVAIFTGGSGASNYTARGPTDVGTETDAGLIRWYDPDHAGTGLTDEVGNVLYLAIAVGPPSCSF